MPSYTAYKRQVMDADDNITWITMKGNHIPIKEGQTKEEAVKEFLAKKGEGSAKHGSGSYIKVKGASQMGSIPDNVAEKHIKTVKEKTIGEMEKAGENVSHLKQAMQHVHYGFYEERGKKMTPTQFKEFLKSEQEKNAGKNDYYANRTKQRYPEAEKLANKDPINTAKTKEHKDLDDMLQSVMAYGGHKMSPEDILSSGYHGKYLEEYVKKYGENTVKEAIKDMQSKIDHIDYGVATGSEGESYNSIVWKESKGSAQKEKTNQTQKAIQSDLGKFADAYNKLYQDKDSFEYNPSDLDKEYNKAMHNDKFKQWVQSMVKERGDVFASDRELHALLIVAKEKGLIPQEKKAKAKSKSDSPLVKAVAKALGKSESEAESEINGAAQYIKDLMKAKDLRNGDVEETLRGLGVEPDYAEEFLHWATYMKNN